MDEFLANIIPEIVEEADEAAVVAQSPLVPVVTSIVHNSTLRILGGKVQKTSDQPFILCTEINGGSVASLLPSVAGVSHEIRGNFKVIAKSQEEEDAYDWTAYRNAPRPNGVIGSVAHLVKGALGAGIMAAHTGYKLAGLIPGVIVTLLAGIYVGYCLYILVRCAQILYKRCHLTIMSYPDVGECAVACFPNPKISRLSKPFRYLVDLLVCVELFGACACYQLMIAKTIKQLVENTIVDTDEGAHGLPHIRAYVAMMLIPIILICLIPELKWLTPFSLVANGLLVLCIGVTIYYFAEKNPHFENIRWAKDFLSAVEYSGMAVFSMSCVGVVLPVTNNMKEPKKFGFVMLIGMSIIALFVFLMSFFGYVAFLEKSQSPIILNFGQSIVPTILKGLVAVMIYMTHALNFFTPFHLCWAYIKPKCPQKNILRFELLFRAIFVIAIGLVAIAFPHINPLIGFIGAFCLSNMAFIWPNLIEILVLYAWPGYGPYKWRLWKCIILITIGFLILIVGSIVNMRTLIKSM